MGLIYLSFKNMVEDDAKTLLLPTSRTAKTMSAKNEKK